MKTASVKQIKEELVTLPQEALLQLCLRLVKFKKDNKELLTYLLFEAPDEQGYVNAVKAMLDELFAEVNIKNLYYAKKTLRKIVRTANKYIKYSGKETTEVEILLYCCTKINGLGLKLSRSTVLENLYNGLLKKIRNAIDGMHEDLQYDYRKELQQVTG